MSKDKVVAFQKPDQAKDLLTELLRSGAQKLIVEAVKVEFEAFLSNYEGVVDANGRAAVVRNGHQPERHVLTGIGPVVVTVPKVRSRRDEAAVFRSALVPPYVRRAKALDAALPWLYLHGISTGNMSEALVALVGPQAKGLSAPVVSRLKHQWSEEYAAWRKTPLGKDRWVYVWADGIYAGLRAEQERLCMLVVIGVNTHGEKRLLAVEDGVRESKQSWREVLLGLKARGLSGPELGIGDGALGFWAALDEVYPKTRDQRCWVHKTVNVLNYLPKALQPKAKAGLHEIWMAETRAQAHSAFDLFVQSFQAKYPKATECLAKDRQALLAFYDFPAEHWVHIRTSNVIESTFGTIRHRTDRARGCVSRQTMLAFVFKLGLSAQKGWCRLRGFKQLAKVITGVRFRDGIELQERNTKKRIQEISRVAA